MTADLLPKHLRVLHSHVHTVLAALDAYARCEQLQAWGVEAARKKDQAAHVIERRMIAAADSIGILPQEKQMYHDIINSLQAENRKLATTLHELTTGGRP